MKNLLVVSCPACLKAIQITQAQVNQKIRCPFCRQKMVARSNEPRSMEPSVGVADAGPSPGDQQHPVVDLRKEIEEALAQRRKVLKRMAAARDDRGIAERD